MSFRDIKRKARNVLHGKLKVPALYIVPVTSAIVPCYVRIHSQWKALGDVAGTSFAYAEREERVPEIIFDRRQVRPQRLGIVSVEPGEAYCVDHVLPQDLEWEKARATPMSADETVGLPVPADHDADYAALFHPALFGAEASPTSYAQVALTPAYPIILEFGSRYVLPLSSHDVVEDNLKGVFNIADLLAGDKVNPPFVHGEYDLRVDIVLDPIATDNSVTLTLDVGAPEAVIFTKDQPITRSTSSDQKHLSLTAKVFATPAFAERGGELAIEFEQDVKVQDIRIYLST